MKKQITGLKRGRPPVRFKHKTVTFSLEHNVRLFIDTYHKENKSKFINEMISEMWAFKDFVHTNNLYYE